MRPFTYARATDAEQAADLVAEQPDAVYLAGGTNLVDLMKLGVMRPGALIDVTALGLDRIEHRPDGGVLIGATVRNSDLAGDPGIRQRYPVLSQALLAGASGQLRSVATTGGNLLQRTRCVYFQDVTNPCNKREPGRGCSAIEGLHRDLAVIGTSEHCVASHPSDMAVALAVLDARVHVRRPSGERIRLTLEELYRLPGSTPDRETVLERGDLITGVEIPAPPQGARMHYRKIRDRASYAFAVVSIAALVVADGGGILREIRIALGGVAPRPWRASRLERALVGRRPDADTLRSAGQEEFAEARPLPRNAFKVGLAINLISATVSELMEGERA